MTVRRWLMTADCWRCEVSISLDYYWESVESPKPIRRQSPNPNVAAPITTTHTVREPKQVPGEEVAHAPVPVGRAAHPSKIVEAVAPAKPTRPSGTATKDRSAPRSTSASLPLHVSQKRRHWRSVLHEVLACFMSVLVHVLLLLLLALLTFPGKEESPPQIQLSLHLDPRRIDGGIPTEPDVIEHTGFKLPVASTVPQEMPIPAAELWAEEVQEGPREKSPNLPPLAQVKADLDSDDQYRRMLSARDPRIRREVIRQEGGTSRTEAAVARALRWMSVHQRDDGSWPLDAFHFAPTCHGQCGDAGRIRSGPGGTALVLLAMLGAGQTHLTGIYCDQVADGLDYLLLIQAHNGDLRGDTRANAGMYVQALATIALCDTLAMTGEIALRDPAQAAVDFIVMAQHANGGWRYEPGQVGDTSVLGWQLMALHSAIAAGLHVSGSALLGADTYLNVAQTDDLGAFYAYRPGGPPTPAMTAEGLLSRMYLGWQRNDPGLRAGVLALLREYPPDPENPNVYYWYYATQVMHHWGGPQWMAWNRKMRDVLVSSQVEHGHEDGSWEPVSPHGHQGGRLYMTALACCTLEVYYRHAPIFRKIEL